MLSTRVSTLPDRTAALAWRTALFSSATVEGGSSMSRIQTDIWSKTCSIGFMSGLLASHSMTWTSGWSKKASVPMATFDSSGSGCTDARSWLHHDQPTPPPHGGWHHTPWLLGHDFHHSAGCRHQSASPLAYSTPGPDRHCGIERTGTHHWRYSVSIVRGPTLCASSPTHGSVACAPKWA